MSEKHSISPSFTPQRGRMDKRPPTSHHAVVCAYCANPFDLFAASWCLDAKEPEPSKVCPHCERCMCDHPAYGEPHFWKQAPLGFQRQGFQRLFLYYL